jgi:HAD superfamily hydrolase (TIGR01509 family)
MPTTDAVIFDCDGVLVDSETICQRVELACLAEIGLTYDRDIYADRFLGTNTTDFFRLLNDDHHSHFGRALPDGFTEMMHTRIVTAMAAEVTAIVGVHDTIGALKVPKAVASGSSTESLRLKLRKVALFDSFDPHIYSAQIVPRGKPAPDIYLHAAEALGVTPDRCIAVEDSVNGAMSAQAAGMTVIGFTGGGHCSPTQAARLRAAGAKDVAATMDELRQILV